jgi:hypothetical protein
MAAFKGPVTIRTSRSQALKMGTDPKGFDGMKYDAMGGVPELPGTSAHQKYYDVACHGAAPIAGAPIISSGISFNMKGGK